MSSMQSLKPAELANGRIRSLAERLDRKTGEVKSLKSEVSSVASLTTGLAIGSGGLLVALVERQLPGVAGLHFLGVPAPAIGGALGVAVGAFFGSRIAVDVAGGVLAVGLHKAFGGGTHAPPAGETPAP